MSELKKYSSYKDSGVEWLGMVPEHWEIRRFKYLFTEINERSEDGSEDLLSVSQYTGVTKRKDRVGEGDLITTATTLEGYKKVYKGDLVSNIMLAWNGSLGFSKYDGIASPAYSVYRLNNELSIGFFHYLVRSEIYKAEFKRQSSGIMESRLRLYTDDFYDIWSVVPPAKEQAAIASFLDQKTTQIDRAIELKEQSIALLKERKQIVIQELVTGKWRIDNGELKMRNKSELKDSGVEWIGEVPKEWEVKRLKTLGYIYSGLSGKSGSDFNVEDIESVKPFIPFTNIYRNLKIDTTQYQYVKIGNFEIQNRVIKNDLLFLMSSETLEDIGKSAIYLGNDAELYLNSFCRGFRITSNQAYPNYINYLLSSQCYRDYFSVVARGFTRINLKQEYVNNAFILLPDMATQHEIAGFLDQYDIDINKAISLQEQEIEKLKELKATLIDGAVTGKIRVIEN